jgi:hypothetical protein
VHGVPPYAGYKINGSYLCWSCFACLFPDRANLKIRKEHYILAELERLVPELSGLESVWDCPVPGGCSLKRPDKLYILPDRYIQIEVDEFGHEDYDCHDEDTRLEIIAADVDLPGLVVRINPDSPPCFTKGQLQNGEVGLWKRALFDVLCLRAAHEVRVFMNAPPPEGVERRWVDAR